ncbi:MAG: putative toxin-antitoxin system toxin component, PIN family [Bacteroidetes bacterium]|nr:putative toxin-antitoxin system toxin component, PIN family [Bacteroidota bacterium]
MPRKIIIDTNLWISFLITGNFSQLDTIILERKCKQIFSEELLNEFLSVVKRPKFRKFFEPEDIENLLEVIEDYAEFVDVKTSVSICRDMKNNFLLSLAIDAMADYLITGDKDLLELVNIDNTKILTMSQFLALI